jgi:transcriptional regulator with XRE-family HTH domain
LETIYEMLPKRLRALQESRKLTQEVAAELCELPLRTYQAVLYAQHFPRKAVLIKLCRGFGVEMDYFFASGGGVVHAEHDLEECARRLYEHVAGHGERSFEERAEACIQEAEDLKNQLMSQQPKPKAK